MEGCHSGCRPSLSQINHTSLANRELLLQCVLKGYSSETGMAQVIKKKKRNGRRQTSLSHNFLSFSTPAGWFQSSYPEWEGLCREEGREGGRYPKQGSASPWTCAGNVGVATLTDSDQFLSVPLCSWMASRGGAGTKKHLP